MADGHVPPGPRGEGLVGPAANSSAIGWRGRDHNRTRWTRLAPAGAAALLTLGATALPPSASAAGGRGTVPGPSDWPAFGHDIHHSFTGVTSLTPGTAASLTPAWFFQTGGAVTANPIVVRSTVYFGSWDGYFYAVDRSAGTLRWVSSV